MRAVLQCLVVAGLLCPAVAFGQLLPYKCVPKAPAMVKGKKSGEERVCRDNGDYKTMGTWKAGQKHGVWNTWYDNGQKETEWRYRKGKLQGKQISWYRTGSKYAEGNFNNNLIDGDWTYWHDNGRKKSLAKYSKGKKVGRWLEFSRSGYTRTEIFQPNGTYTIYIQRLGVMIAQGRVLDGVVHGPYVGYDIKGVVLFRGEMFQGERHGEWVYYHRNGRVSGEEVWHTGERISVREWDRRGRLINEETIL